ncbi:hypothetical protein GC173_10815 [bacterium]|nr:hypothetical protein [bacterium]
MNKRYENLTTAVEALGGSLGLVDTIKEILQCTRESAWDLCAYKDEPLNYSVHDYLRLCDALEVETAHPDSAILRSLSHEPMKDLLRRLSASADREDIPSVAELSLDLELDLHELASRHHTVQELPVEIALDLYRAGLLRVEIEDEPAKDEPRNE